MSNKKLDFRYPPTYRLEDIEKRIKDNKKFRKKFRRLQTVYKLTKWESTQFNYAFSGRKRKERSCLVAVYDRKDRDKVKVIRIITPFFDVYNCTLAYYKGETDKWWFKSKDIKQLFNDNKFLVDDVLKIWQGEVSEFEVLTEDDIHFLFDNFVDYKENWKNE